MAVIHNSESVYAKEMQQWNTPKRHGGFAPDGYEPFPKMLYKAQPHRNGKMLCMADPVSPYGWRDEKEYDRAVLEAESFSRTCQMTVKSEDEMQRAYAMGWCQGPDEAIAKVKAAHDELGRLAAEENYRVLRMSEKARQEFDTHARTTHEHVAEVPVPKKKPHWRTIKAAKERAEAGA